MSGASSLHCCPPVDWPSFVDGANERRHSLRARVALWVAVVATVRSEWEELKSEELLSGRFGPGDPAVGLACVCLM